MKEMVYTENRHTPEILDKGEYRGVEYVVISLGTHPTAYVENVAKAADEDDKRISNVSAHGGFTYYGPDYWNPNKTHDTTYLGWDYAHAGDFVGWHSHCAYWIGEKHWLTEEIVVECKRVIDQLLNLIEFENNQKK